MTSQNALQKISARKSPLPTVITGALSAFVLITIFFFGDGGSSDFGFRVYFPTITTTFGGASAGLFYWLAQPIVSNSRFKWLLVPICFAACLAIVFFSAVAGLAVTGDWD